MSYCKMSTVNECYIVPDTEQL
uniref:Uncharacterized protein n=1 Tax=Anguilla anguilla TaxID=7936 RepID=A0A0E9S1Q4_ANGAN